MAMNLRLLLKDFAWPVIAGVALAMLYLQRLPEPEPAPPPAGNALPETRQQSTAVMSYAAAVERAMPAVVKALLAEGYRFDVLPGTGREPTSRR